MLPATRRIVTFIDRDLAGSPGDGSDTPRIGGPDSRVLARGEGTADQGAARRTFARRIDCSLNESKGSTGRGGRRAPTRGGGSPDSGGHAA